MNRSPAESERPQGGTLIIQPLPGIGDMVWHLPHIHRIARASADGTVTILTKPRSRADKLLAGDPSVAKVLWLERSPGKHDGLLGLLRLVNLLRRERFARVWVLHQSSRYVWAARLAGIPERIGYGRGAQRWLLSHPLQLPKEALHGHPIEMADRLLALHGLPEHEDDPRLPVAAPAAAAIARRYGRLPGPWVALGVGSSEHYKQWGTARFAELAAALQRAGAGTLFVLGGPAEEDMARVIAERTGSGVVSATSLLIDEAAALLADCALYVGNDTGFLNMAAALAVPAVGLFGGSPPLRHSRFIHPVLPEPRDGGMQVISVAQALAAVRSLGLLEP